MIRPKHFGVHGVSATVCQQIQCGLITQSQAGYDLLLACSRAGYAGVRTAFDPLCQQLAGGGPVAVATQGAAAARVDPLPDNIQFYDPAPDGAPRQWFALPSGSSIPESQLITSTAATAQPAALDWIPPGNEPSPVHVVALIDGRTAPDWIPPGNEPPTAPADTAPTSDTPDTFDAVQYAKLIGSTDLVFGDREKAQAWLDRVVGGPLKSLIDRGITIGPLGLPWALWLAIAAGTYALTRKGKR